MKLESLKIADITHAPWNPRSPEELDPAHPAMQELAKSLRAVGLINPITVWGRVCIAGNRRLVAARLALDAAGVDPAAQTISAMVYAADELDEPAARAITRAENEARFGVSPLADARQIRELMDRANLAQNDIASLFGVSEATVCRRAKLLDLDQSLVAELEARKASARTLEILASYPAELQRDIVHRTIGYGQALDPRTVQRAFWNITRAIDPSAWPFAKGPHAADRLRRCTSCANCTACAPLLFGFEELAETESAADRATGRCMDHLCWERLEAEAKEDVISSALAKHAKPIKGTVNVKSPYTAPWTGLTANRPSKANSFAYILWDKWSHELKIKFGPDPSIVKRAAKAAEAERRAREEAAQEAARPFNDAVNRISNYFYDVESDPARLLWLAQNAPGLRDDVTAEELAALKAAAELDAKGCAK